MKYYTLALSTLLTLLLFSSCGVTEKKMEFFGSTQGTYYSIIYYAQEPLITQTEIDSILTNYDNSVSLWVENSLLSCINRNETDSVDAIFAENFQLAKTVYSETEGAFDCSIGDLINAWGFGFKQHKMPSEKVIDSLYQLRGMDKCTIENNKISKPSYTQLNFNAIAQGHSVELVSRFLEGRNITSYLIDIGGEIKCGAAKPNGEMWLVGIEKPPTDSMQMSEREIQKTLQLENTSIATSGSYRKFYIADGKRYSHTIDPSTGRPVTHSLLSATVICTNTSLADGYATALMVMGVEKAKQFIAQHNSMEAILIFENENHELELWESKELCN